MLAVTSNRTSERETMHTSTITDERGKTYRAESTHGHECGACREAEKNALAMLRVTGSVACNYGDTGNCHARVERIPETEPRFIVRRTLSYARTVKGRTDDLAEAIRWAERETALGYPCEVIDSATITKAAVELEPGDVLIGGTARKLKTVTGTSRAAASSEGRICVFATTTNVDGELVRVRFFFELEELVEVVPCTGHRYAVNPDAVEEGTDIRHEGPCPAHPAEAAEVAR